MAAPAAAARSSIYDPRPELCVAVLCPWQETVLFSFLNGIDGAYPGFGNLIFQAGDICGSTAGSGNSGLGTVYELMPSGSGWTENVLYNFQGESDGSTPAGGLVIDQSGNLYGTTMNGYHGGPGGGTAYQLSPSGGGWTFTTLYSFSGHQGSAASLTMDAAGNLYGTTIGDGARGLGNVFKLIRSAHGWTYASIYDFTGGSDGMEPFSNVIFDPNGNLYGTATHGGSGSACDYGCVTVGDHALAETRRHRTFRCNWRSNRGRLRLAPCTMPVAVSGVRKRN